MSGIDFLIRRTRPKTGIGLIGALFAAAMVAGCGGGGGGEPAAPPNNFAASALQVLSPDPRIGYPLKVSVTITADRAADNVSVSLFAVEKNQNPAVVTRQIPLGSQTIPRVEAGSYPYELEINIPSSVELPGAYFIGAIVNPASVIAETDEADNVASTEATVAAASPNIFLKEAALDRTALELDTTPYAVQVPGTVGNVHNSDAGATITVGADGLDVNATIDLQAFAKLRLMRSDKGTQHDVPLYLWNSDAGRYTNAFGIDPSVPPSFDPFDPNPPLGTPEWLPIGQFKPQLVETAGEDVTVNDVNRDSMHLDFYFPGKLASELEIGLRHLPVLFDDPPFPPPDLSPQSITQLRSFLFGLPGIEQGNEGPAMAVMSFAICIGIRPADPTVVDRFPDDNEICSPLTVTLPPRLPIPIPPIFPPGFTPHFPNPSHPLLSDSGFSSKWGGSTLGYGIDFSASSSADYRGLIMETRGALPVTVFGSTIDLVKAVARAQLLPEYLGKPQDEHPGFTLQLRFADQLLASIDAPPIGSPPAVAVTFSKERKIPQPIPPETCPFRFVAVVVPMCLTPVVSGNLGIEYEAIFTATSLSFSAAPLANLEAALSLAVDVGAFSAGVEGALTLVEEKFVVSDAVAVVVHDDGFASRIAEFVITRTQKMVNELTGAKGQVSVFVEYSVPTVKKCSWGFFTGLCPGIAKIKAKKDIPGWGWKALFRKIDVIFEQNGMQLDVVVVEGMPPAYFSP